MTPAEWIALVTAAAATIGAGVTFAARIIVAALRELIGVQKETTAAQKETTAQITGLREGFAELRGALDVLMPRPIRQSTPPPRDARDDEHTPIRGTYSHVGRTRKD